MTGRGGKILWQVARWLAATGAAAQIAVAFTGFSPWLALTLPGLALATLWRPWLGVSALMVAVSADKVGKVAGLQVSFSEFEFGVCLLVWVALRREGWKGIDWRPLIWAAPFILAVLASSTLNNHWYRTVPLVVRTSELFAALFLSANVFVAAGQRARCVWPVAIATVTYCGSGLLLFFMATRSRAASVFTNANQFAAYINLLLPALLAQFLATRARRFRIAWGLLLGLGVLSACSAQSRAGLAVGGLAMMTIYALHSNPAPRPEAESRWWLRRRWVHALLFFSLAVGLAWVLSEGQPWMPHRITQAWNSIRGRSLIARLPYYRTGIQIWKEHFWLGVGPGNYGRAVDELLREGRSDFQLGAKPPPFLRTHVHCLYLQLGAQFGVIGLVAFVWFMFRLWRVFFREWRQSPWCLAGLGAVLAWSLHNLVDVTFPSLALETGLFLGAFLPSRPPAFALAAADPDPHAEAESTREPSPSIARFLTVVGACARLGKWTSLRPSSLS